MRILICDDTQSDLDVTYSYVTEYFNKKNINVKIDCFTDCNILLDKIEFIEDAKYDLYFLDVIMQQNGINVAGEIIKRNQNPNIIFTTSSKEYAIDAFKVQAFDYILKPLNKNELYDSIDRILKKINIKKTAWNFKTNDLSLISINLENIVYIESANRRIEVHLSDNTTITSTTIRTSFLETIPFDLTKNSFLLCHNSYIVNMNKIKGIRDYDFIMINGKSVPISKRMLKDVKEQYINYLVGDTNEIR
jgi:DNA-binding LytR/AlgR family response regulator